MDVAAFSGDSFDPKEWINKALKPAGPVVQNKEAAASSLVMKLQLMIAKLNSALEEQCGSVVSSVPRVVREAEQLAGEAGLLRDKLVTIRRQVESVESETAENMGSLVKMDLVKERVTATSRALQEADNWTSLDNQVEDAFDNDDLDGVARLLTGMQSSLRLLSHVADYSERVAHLEQHRNRLEATLSPLLVAAFSKMDTGAALRLVNMFRGMERGRNLSKYYTKCVRAGLLQRWTTIVNSEDTSEVGGGLKEWLQQFYCELVNSVGEHVVWVGQVFPEEKCQDLVVVMLTEVLASQEPSQEFCLEAALKLTNSELGLLVELKQITDQFLTEVGPLLEGAGLNKLRDLGLAAYRPYRSQVARYEELEGLAIRQEMAGWTTGGKDTIDEIHSLTGCVAKLAPLVESAATRCISFTKAVAFPELAAAVAAGLDLHLDRYRRIMRRLEKRKGVVDDDWSVLQHCLTANQATGDLLLQLEQLDVSLSLSFLEATRQFLGPEGTNLPLQQHHLFLLDPPALLGLTELHSRVSSNTGSATPILLQSISLLSSACSDLQKTTFSIMFHPISSQLELIPGLDTWSANTAGPGSLETGEMPDFSFSPCEYITCVGEYLMTLPQHLEPYMAQDHPALSRAFREAVFPGSEAEQGGSPQSPADFLLGCISSSTCSSYLSYIGSIPVKLTTNSAKQLAVDIGYLGDILDDLGHPLSGELSSTAVLLRLPAESWARETGGHPSKVISIVSRVRGMGETSDHS